jgi:hypothetical protein
MNHNIDEEEILKRLNFRDSYSTKLEEFTGSDVLSEADWPF